jgi:hypothetical protein
MRSQMAFARGALGGLVWIRSHCGEDYVEGAGEPAVPVLEQERHAAGALAMSISRLAVRPSSQRIS